MIRCPTCNGLGEVPTWLVANWDMAQRPEYGDEAVGLELLQAQFEAQGDQRVPGMVWNRMAEEERAVYRAMGRAARSILIPDGHEVRRREQPK
jgi:hypothetical protein